jgi:hypothetical protein
MMQDLSIMFATELLMLLNKQDAALPLTSHVPDHAFLEGLGVAAEKVENSAVTPQSDPALALLIQELRLVMRDVQLAIESATAVHLGAGLDPTLILPAVSKAIGDILEEIRSYDE